MGISLYKIKKWYKMLTGKSILHVNQDKGTCYSKEHVAGYYNDLTEKVTKDDPDILVPQYSIDSGESIYFSIGIFQYGLASYDLFLKTNEEKYKKKLIACADWALDNQQTDGSWITFAYKNKAYPYSSMAQGEGASMLIRANIITGDSIYLAAAQKAIDFMLIPMVDGGTTEYDGEDVLLYEYTGSSAVLNGWIFSLWGLYDYYKYTKDDKVESILNKTLVSLKKNLHKYDIKYWSKYDLEKNISSPFYHKLHIAQLRVMYDLFGDVIYKEYADKWERYQNSFWKRKRAFLKKAFQKIFY